MCPRRRRRLLFHACRPRSAREYRERWSEEVRSHPKYAPREAELTRCLHRIDAGGKLLTNHLKELVSFRQWYMMDQTSVIEHAKEECCYVTNEWERDWVTAK